VHRVPENDDDEGLALSLQDGSSPGKGSFNRCFIFAKVCDRRRKITSSYIAVATAGDQRRAAERTGEEGERADGGDVDFRSDDEQQLRLQQFRLQQQQLRRKFRDLGGQEL